MRSNSRKLKEVNVAVVKGLSIPVSAGAGS